MLQTIHTVDHNSVGYMFIFYTAYNTLVADVSFADGPSHMAQSHSVAGIKAARLTSAVQTADGQ